MLKGTNQELGKPFNKRIVLDLIRKRGPIARTAIAEHVGLTVQTVSSIVRELEDDGLLVSQRKKPTGRGVPPSMLAVNPDGGFAIGLHLAPDAVRTALINMHGDVISRLHQSLDGTEPDAVFAIIGDLVGRLAKERRGFRLLGAGLAMPGPFGVQSMSFVGGTTMAGWQDIDIVGRMSEATGLPSFVETDMAAAALGEQLYGWGTVLNDYYYLFFGLGLGGAMVHEGHALRGNWGNAGELGHLTAIPGGEACPCGNKGCLERYVSLDALRRSGLPERVWAEQAFPVLSQAMRSVENLFDPETIVIGGACPPSLLERLIGSESFGNSIAARSDRIHPRAVVAKGGEEAVLRGAAALAVRGALSPRDGHLFGQENTTPFEGARVA